MHNFWGNDSGSKQDAGILCCPEGQFEWISIQRGQAIPPNAVQAGQTPRDGVTYVGRSNGLPSPGEAGKINVDGGKMWSFWGHQSGGHQGAEILVTVDVAASRTTVLAAAAQPRTLESPTEAQT